MYVYIKAGCCCCCFVAMMLQNISQQNYLISVSVKKIVGLLVMYLT